MHFIYASWLLCCLSHTTHTHQEQLYVLLKGLLEGSTYFWAKKRLFILRLESLKIFKFCCCHVVMIDWLDYFTTSRGHILAKPFLFNWKFQYLYYYYKIFKLKRKMNTTTYFPFAVIPFAGLFFEPLHPQILLFGCVLFPSFIQKTCRRWKNKEFNEIMPLQQLHTHYILSWYLLFGSYTRIYVNSHAHKWMCVQCSK